MKLIIVLVVFLFSSLAGLGHRIFNYPITRSIPETVHRVFQVVAANRTVSATARSNGSGIPGTVCCNLRIPTMCLVQGVLEDGM